MKFTINRDKLTTLKINKKEKIYTILLVDDEISNLEALSRLLEDEYNVVKAKNGVEALDIL